jgi:hypothetical protein
VISGGRWLNKRRRKLAHLLWLPKIHPGREYFEDNFLFFILKPLKNIFYFLLEYLCSAQLIANFLSNPAGYTADKKTRRKSNE